MSNTSNKDDNSTFVWDPISALRKIVGNTTFGINIGIVSVSVNPTGGHDPKRDAYRNCGNCGKHTNFHDSDKKCPPKK